MEEEKKISKDEVYEMLVQLEKAYDNLPPGAMVAPLTHYDFHSLLLILLALLREDSN
jgi:hypothetical protein